jgi:hypothetical protein
MVRLNTHSFCFLLILLALCLTFIFPVPANSQDVSVEAETGLLWFSRNDVRIPNEGGTDFDMINLIGREVAPYYRFRVNFTFSDRHTVRFLIAPLTKIGTGIFNEPVFFEDTVFEADTPVDGTYKFNTYRLTYRYQFYDRNGWVLGAGVAGLIRDAKIELVQPNQFDSNTDVGFVPLVHLYAERRIGNLHSIIVDAETLAAPQGRATDAALLFNFGLSEKWSLFTGYRLLEGGADVDEVYNFSWINFALFGLVYC